MTGPPVHLRTALLGPGFSEGSQATGLSHSRRLDGRPSQGIGPPKEGNSSSLEREEPQCGPA